MAQSLYLPVVLLAAVAGMAVAFVAWVRGDRPGARPLTLFVVAASFWAVAEALSIATAGLGSVRFWTQVGLSLSTVIPIAWLATVLAYTGNEDWLTRHTLVALLVEPAVFTFLVWTSPDHALVWTDGGLGAVGRYSTFVMEFGLAFWAHQAYSYLLVALGGLLLVRMIRRTTGVYRLQSTALLGAIAVPMVGNALYIFGFVPDGIDLTAPGYVVSGVVLALAMFRTELLRLTPAIRELGREEVLSELDDSVLIVDEYDRIVDANPAGAALLDTSRENAIGSRLGEQLPTLADALDDDVTQTKLRLDLDGNVRYYDVRVSSLYRHRGVLSGRLISLRDVTEQHQREQRLDVLNRVLRHNVRNELNVVRGNVELARNAAHDGVRDRLDTAMGTLDTVIGRTEKVGQLSRLFETDAGGELDLADILRNDLPKTLREYPDADVTLDLPEVLPVAAGPAVTAVFEELVRNALEHNDVPTVSVSVDEEASDDSYVVVAVRDDGTGIDDHERRVIEQGRETALDHSSGVGLWLANWVVERNGGTLSIAPTDVGTTVRVRLPRPRPERSDDRPDASVTDVASVTTHADGQNRSETGTASSPLGGRETAGDGDVGERDE